MADVPLGNGTRAVAVFKTVLRSKVALVLCGAVGCAPPPSVPTQPSNDDATATLVVVEPEGALIYVDDEAVGVAPMERAVSIAPGEHEVAVFAAGHRAHRRPVALQAGERRAMAVDLEATDQRIASFVLLGVGAASLTAGIVLGAMAQVERGGTGMWQDDGAEPLTLGAGLTGGLGALLIVTGGALFVLDVPALPDAPAVMIGPTGVTTRF